MTRQVTELARMRISNDGEGTSAWGNYNGITYRGRDRDTLDRGVTQREARIERFPRESRHVWNLVAAMLFRMGYKL